jgi:predicted CxxxxCH...CXXCH cytochrome family protein
LNIATLPFYAYTSNKSTGADDGTTAANFAFGCANCHPTDAAKHVDGFIDVEISSIAAGGSLRLKNVAPALVGSPGTNVVKCQNVYCHSDGKGAWPVTETMQWNQNYSAVDRCAQCHGNSPTGVGAHAAHVVGIHYDDIFNGTSGKLIPGTTGSVSHGLSAQATTLNCDTCHNATVSYARNNRNTVCTTCHPTGTDTATTQSARVTSISKHVNGAVDVQFKAVQFISKAQLRPGSFDNYTGGVAGWVRNGGNYKNGAAAFDKAKNDLTIINWNNITKSCSNVVCHNMKSGQSVLWTDSLTCDSCHSSL